MRQPPIEQIGHIKNTHRQDDLNRTIGSIYHIPYTTITPRRYMDRNLLSCLRHVPPCGSSCLRLLRPGWDFNSERLKPCHVLWALLTSSDVLLLSPSLSASLRLSPPLSVSLRFSPSLSVSLFLSPSLSVPLCLRVRLSLSLSLSLSLFLSG